MTAWLAEADPVVPGRWRLYCEGRPVEVLNHVHPAGRCATQGHCTLHDPGNHQMRWWPLVWVPSPLGAFYRLCEHGAEHPDPDSLVALLVLGKIGSAVTHMEAHVKGCKCQCCDNHVPF